MSKFLKFYIYGLIICLCVCIPLWVFLNRLNYRYVNWPKTTAYVVETWTKYESDPYDAGSSKIYYGRLQWNWKGNSYSGIKEPIYSNQKGSYINISIDENNPNNIITEKEFENTSFMYKLIIVIIIGLPFLFTFVQYLFSRKKKKEL